MATVDGLVSIDRKVVTIVQGDDAAAFYFPFYTGNGNLPVVQSERLVFLGLSTAV